MLVLSKPPPPPPKAAKQHSILQPKTSIITGTKDAGYPLPMAGDMPAWYVVLQRCGFPTDVLVIDFETYFDEDYHMGRSADSLSTIEYVTDSRFEVVSCAFTLIRQPFADHEQHTTFQAGENAVGIHLEYLKAEFGDNLEKLTVVIQNAQFDCTILAKHYGIHPRHVVDLLGIARHLNARQKHGLETLTKQYGLKEKGDTAEFKGVTFRNRIKKQKGRKKGPKLPLAVPKITDDQLAALQGYNVNDNLREWELFTMMLPLLSNPAIELRLMQHTLELFTKPVLRVDASRAEEITAAMEAEIDKVIPPGLERPIISGDKSFENVLVAALEEAGDTPQKYYKVGKPCAARPNGMLLAIAKTDPEREQLLNHPSPRVRQVMAARSAIDSWPNHIKRVKRLVDQSKANGGVLCVPLKYHGAHTGRWSGAESLNLQNLGSRGHELINAVRTLLIAPDEYWLVIVDLAAIEARVLNWIAGQLDVIEKFARNEDVYCAFAAKVLGFPVRKPRRDDLPAIAKRLTWARNAIGKIGVLGCGYGMGGDKTEAYAGGAIDNATAHKIVETYRTEHPEVVGFWRAIERAFIYTAKYQRSCEMPRSLRFDSSPACDVIITLPNGRELHYAKVRVADGGNGRETAEIYNATTHSWEYTWGGTLTENVVQAMSRDVLAESMLRLEDMGYHTALHVHDELVLCVPNGVRETALHFAIQEMSRTPAWAPGLPLAAEGKIKKVYEK